MTVAKLAGAYVAADGGRLQLFDDGTLQAEGLNQDDSLLSGPGRWSLAADYDTGDIRLTFTYAPGHLGAVGEELNITGTSEKPELYWYLGDADSCDLHLLTRM